MMAPFMMSRTQISLDPELQRRARQRAARLGVSFAEYVRRLVERDLGHTSRGRGSVAAVFDLGSSGGADVARDKDGMVASAVAARRKRHR
jgi:hypothetical protein